MKTASNDHTPQQLADIIMSLSSSEMSKFFGALSNAVCLRSSEIINDQIHDAETRSMWSDALHPLSNRFVDISDDLGRLNPEIPPKTTN